MVVILGVGAATHTGGNRRDAPNLGHAHCAEACNLAYGVPDVMGRLYLIIPLATLIIIVALSGISGMRRGELLVSCAVLAVVTIGTGVWYFSPFEWWSWRQLTTTMPDGERQFLQFLETAKARNNPAANPAAQSSPGQARVCGFPGIATNWEGKVGWIYLLLGDNLALSVKIAPQVIARSSDGFNASGSSIKPGAPIYGQAKGLKEGDIVRFSGTFQKDEMDCLIQDAAGRDNAGAEAFLLQFNSISPIR